MNNTFSINIIPPGDEQRVAAMHRYQLLDSPSETVFDNMTAFAAKLFGTPIALISLVDTDLVFFKSSAGAGGIKCAGRGESLCALAILNPEIMVFEDALLEPVAAGSAPLRHGVRFYAGAPLCTKDGYLIGTLCVVDFKPRNFSPHERSLLEDLARIVMEQMELRLVALTEIGQQQKLAEQKDEFISIASHELKTPLTSLTASLQALERIPEDARAGMRTTLIAQANKSIQKLNRLVTDLLNVKQMGNGQLPLNPGRFEVGRLVAGHIAALSDAVRCRVSFSSEEDLEVFGDEQKVEQVLVNLVNNAVKFTPAPGRVSVRLSRQGNFARIDVHDDGPGIAAKDRSRVFERYYRSAQHNISGLGLGLYIVSEIVKLHGGQTGLESEPGKGSTFWFTLPLNLPEKNE